MTYTAQHTGKIKTAAKGPRRVHELGLATGRSLCARKNDAAASNTRAGPRARQGRLPCDALA